MGIQLTGFEGLLDMFDHSADSLHRRTVITVRKLSEKVAGKARLGAPVREGRLRNSIEGYVEIQGDLIEGGAKTSYPAAVFHEFGTGPVGDKNPHPLDGELGITRRPDGWTYWSEAVAAQRDPGGQGEPNGYVYTRGVPARAFMHNALVATEDEIMDSLGAVIEEVATKE